jgi:tRNA threonylcarbamoyladenosine biosynthesis protein TsaE
MDYTIASPDQLAEVAQAVLKAAGDRRIFTLQGDLGAGKTTLVKAFCACLGTGDVVKSPTFALVNTYDAPGGEVFHFDFYRINRLEEAYDLGFEEYFDSGNYCFIEWPEMIAPLLPDTAIRIHITATGPTARHISTAL